MTHQRFDLPTDRSRAGWSKPRNMRSEPPGPRGFVSHKAPTRHASCMNEELTSASGNPSNRIRSMRKLAVSTVFGASILAAATGASGDSGVASGTARRRPARRSCKKPTNARARTSDGSTWHSVSPGSATQRPSSSKLKPTCGIPKKAPGSGCVRAVQLDARDGVARRRSP